MSSQSVVPGPVVVPLDGSGFAEVAVPMGSLLARTTGAPLHFVHVVATPLPSPRQLEELLELEEKLRNRTLIYLRGVARRTQSPPTTQTNVLRGNDGVALALSDYASQTQASWLVLTTHGAGGLSRWLRGSVADALARHAETPLLLLRSWDATGDLASGERRFQAILLPLDGSPESEAALAPAIALARAFKSTLVVTRVVARRAGSARHPGSSADPAAIGYLEGHVDALRAMRLDAEAWPIAHDDAAEGIMAASMDRGCDLICMATHGRGGLGRAVLGSVADRVLTECAEPLALVRPTSE